MVDIPDDLDSLDRAALIGLVRQLVSVVRMLSEVGQDLTAQNAGLQARVADLEARLGKNSKNSSKPPSSDPPFRHLTPPSLKKADDKKSGGQPDHEGQGLKKVAAPDRTMEHSPCICAHCGTSLLSMPSRAAGVWQVYDLPADLSIEVTEHQRLSRCCPNCHKETVGQLPLWLSEATPCQWGPRCRALGVYLIEQQHLPFERARSVFVDLFGAAPSEGTLYNWLQEAYRRLEPVEKLIAEELVSCDSAGADETPVRGIGWLHCFVNARWTWYGCHRKRGREAMEQLGLLPRFGGLLMTDCLSSYTVYGSRRALCNAHLLRDLTEVYQWGHQWPERMIALLTAVWKRVKETDGPLPRSVIHAIHRQFGKILALGRRENEQRLVARSERLLDRLAAYRNLYLRFATTAGAWFDNNISERALRMVKLHVKISGCFRSTLGCRALCRIRGYLSTMQKQEQPIFQAILSVMTGKPNLPPLLKTLN